MAQVFRLIATNKEHPHFESDTANDDFHAAIFFAGYSTACGVQLDGDDGVGMGIVQEGYVTCPICKGIISEVQKIRDWRPNG